MPDTMPSEAKNDPKRTRTNPRSGGQSALMTVAAHLGSLLLLAWVAGLTFYFWQREGLFGWTRLEGRGVPARMLEGRFATVLAHLAAPFNVWWDNVPWIELGIAVVVLGGYFVLGWLLLRPLHLPIPRLAVMCASLPLGAGAVAYATMLLGLAGVLDRWPVLAAWALLFLAAFAMHIAFRGIRVTSVLDPIRLRQEAAHYRRLVSVRPSDAGTAFIRMAVALIATISTIVLVHGVAQAETYWDSLILYMGYARKMFLEQGYPVKVVGQVGIGLGANYPHLYPTLTAQTAALAGYWHDIFAQLLPPVASLVATLFVYLTAAEMTRNRVIGWAAALLFRAVPYGVSYGQYASDYALAIMYTAAFLYFSLLYLRYGRPAFHWLMWLMAAFAVNINYLMGALWPLAALVAVMAHWHIPRLLDTSSVPDPEPPAASGVDDDAVGDDAAAAATLPTPVLPPVGLFDERRPPLRRFLVSARLWMPVCFSLLVAAPWYLRNIILTGNPVYAFFYNLFPSRNVNPEVMRSAEVEWLLNGDGLGRVGRTLGEKLANSWLYFITGDQHWKLAPVFFAFVLPGVLLCMAGLLAHALRGVAGRGGAQCDLARSGTRRFALACLCLFFLLWFYAYAVADFYLYQIIVVLPLFGVFAAWLMDRVRPRFVLGALLVIVLGIGFAPGVVMALMGFKLTRGSETLNAAAPQLQLTALRNVFLDPFEFRKMHFNGDMNALRQLNYLPPGTRVLTHENRHLLLDEKLVIIHLDDWEVQAAYHKPAAERLAVLDELGVDYYFHVPNEDKHRANSWVGMDELIGLGHFREEWRWPSAGGSEREGLDYSHIPTSSNVLYRRVRQ